MEKTAILVGCTYRFFSGSRWYVHDIEGQRVTYCRVGETERRQASLGRFATLAEEQIPNG